MSTVPVSQYEQLMGDFTTINLQLNETRNKLYDAEQQNKVLKETLKNTQAEFTRSSKQLRRARRTIDRSKDKKALDRVLEENSGLLDQLAALKRVLQKMQEEEANKKAEEEQKRRQSWSEFVENQKSTGSNELAANETRAAEEGYLNTDGSVESEKSKSDRMPPLPPRDRAVSGPGLFSDGDTPKAPAGLFDVSEDEDDANSKNNGFENAESNETVKSADKKNSENVNRSIGQDDIQMREEKDEGGASATASPISSGGSPVYVDSGTTKESESTPPPPQNSRRPSVVVEAMAKAQQEELLKLRAALEEETKRSKEQRESFQGDLSRMLTRVAEKESELQSAKSEATIAVKRKEELEAKVVAATSKIHELESKVSTLETSSRNKGKAQEALTAANSKVAKLEALCADLKAEKERCETALKGYSSANEEAMAKMAEEKEQALSELRSDTNIEIALLNDKIKSMERDLESEKSKLESTQEELKGADSKLKESKDKIQELTEGKHQLKKEAEAAAGEIESMKGALSNCKAELKQLTTSNEELSQSLKSKTSKLKVLDAELAESRTQLNETKGSLSKMEKKFEEVKVEHKIASRRQKELIKDLKKSLMKETKRLESMKQNVSSKEKEISSLQNRVEDLEMQIAIAKQAQHREEVEAPVIPVQPRLTDGGRAAGGARGLVGRSPSSGLSGLMKKVQSKIEGKGAGGVQNAGSASDSESASDIDGVKSALAAKLEQLLKENTLVKEKVVMLESIIQDLTNELAVKKEALASLQAESDAGNPFSTSASAETRYERERHSTMADAIDEI